MQFKTLHYMNNSSPESLPHEDNFKSTFEQLKHSNNQHQEQNHSRRSPWVGIRQYTNEFSSFKASPGYIARARLIYNNLCSDLSNNHQEWYVAIEPESGEYFINANKKVAQREARIKHPTRLICTFQLTGAS